MKSLIVALGITFAVLLAVPASDAAASGDGYRSHQGHHHQSWRHRWFSFWRNRGGTGETPPSEPAAVPELDPSAAGGAILLLAGGMLCLVSRRREDELA